MANPNMSIDEFRKLQNAPKAKKGKFNNKPSVVPSGGFPEIAGRRFDSLFEKAVAMDLVVRQRAGEISNLRFQDTVHMTKADITWRIDFSYIEDGRKWYHEVKGFPDKVYPLKLKIYKVYGKEHLRITNGKTSYRRTVVVMPKGAE